jgi:hypothetical protein
MRIARGLVVEDVGDDGVRVAARDWPWALWTSAAGFAPGLPLVAWSLATRHWIELGGGVVFCAFGAACAFLALTQRRDLEIRARDGRVTLSGVLGAGPFRRQVAPDLSGAARFEIRPFETPAGAPDLPDRGGDLLIVADGAQVLVARRVGPGWRRTIETARDRVAASIPQLA